MLSGTGGTIQQSENKKQKRILSILYPPSRDKKTHQRSTTVQSLYNTSSNPNYMGTSDWNSNPKTTWMHKSQHRNMKQQGNSSPSKANSTTKELNNCEKEEI
jgi:hypothetical protein